MTSMEKPANNETDAENSAPSAKRGKTPKQARQDRLSKALKQNLLRRKAATLPEHQE